jgi:hypothetical protein
LSLNSRFLQTFHAPPSTLTTLATVAARATPTPEWEQEPASVVTQAAHDSDLFPPRQGVAVGEEFGYKPSRVTSGELEAVLKALDDDKIPEYAGRFGLDPYEVKQRFLHLRQLYKSRVGHPAIDEKPRKVKLYPSTTTRTSLMTRSTPENRDASHLLLQRSPRRVRYSRAGSFSARIWLDCAESERRRSLLLYMRV